MVLCWLVLPVFAFLGIFSVKYRRLTKESLECLFKTMTFHRCDSGLDQKIKSRVSGQLLKFSPGLARGFYKHYKIISLILLIVFLWSTYSSGIAVYNYVVHGTCNGPDSSAFCVFNSFGGSESESVNCDVLENETQVANHQSLEE